ncbi:hypothetical protein J2790_004457 [Paenarthrobacter nicotinovorans]|nr:hypothetical protein [Paenarthrobacter nicotinovorans]
MIAGAGLLVNGAKLVSLWVAGAVLSVWGFCTVLWWLKGKSPDLWSGLLPNVCPAVSYSPTPSRVQYHRRCGS